MFLLTENVNLADDLGWHQIDTSNKTNNAANMPMGIITAGLNW